MRPPPQGVALPAPRRCVVTLPRLGIRLVCDAVRERRIFGRREYALRPLAGGGEMWVQAETITWEES